MADMIVPFQDDNEELENVIAAELSKNDDLVDYIQVNSLEALKARFSEAEEDENIRSEGFELAKKGGLIRKPHPNEESVMPYMSQNISPKDDIPAEKSSELSSVFEATKSEHDSDNVLFSELDINAPSVQPEIKTEEKAEEKKSEEPTSEEPPKKKRGRPRKNPLSEEAPAEPPKEEKEQNKKTEAEAVKKDDDSEYVLTPKYNTHTEIIYVDESLDDGIKRNSDEELEALFNNNGKGKISKLWRKIKK